MENYKQIKQRYYNFLQIKHSFTNNFLQTYFLVLFFFCIIQPLFSFWLHFLSKAFIMQNLLGTTQSRLAQSLSTQSKQSLSLTHGFFHKVINIGGGGANTLHSLDKSPKNTLYSYKSAKPTKQLFHALIARGFNESPKQSSLSIIARFSNAKSKKSAQFVIARFVCEPCKSVGFSWQSTHNLNPRILDCFDFLQKSRDDEIANLRFDSRICR